MNTQEAIEILECDAPNYADFETVGDYDDAVLEYRQALSHAIKVMKKTEWHPIDSAPKDGTWVLLWGKSGYAIPAFWGYGEDTGQCWFVNA